MKIVQPDLLLKLTAAVSAADAGIHKKVIRLG